MGAACAAPPSKPWKMPSQPRAVSPTRCYEYGRAMLIVHRILSIKIANKRVSISVHQVGMKTNMPTFYISVCTYTQLLGFVEHYLLAELANNAPQKQKYHPAAGKRAHSRCLHIHTTIDINLLTSNIICLSGEEHHCFSNLIR